MYITYVHVHVDNVHIQVHVHVYMFMYKYICMLTHSHTLSAKIHMSDYSEFTINFSLELKIPGYIN